MMVLECSSAGDRRFSALFARVTLAGQTRTIEEWYQLSKRWEGQPPPTSWRQAKGRRPDYLEILGVRVPVRLMSAWYDFLWFRYFVEHPDLAAYARQFDAFHDRFARSGRQNQAQTIERLVRDPKGFLRRPDVQELLRLLRQGIAQGRS